MFSILSSFGSVLTSKPVAILAELACVAAVVALLVIGFQLRIVRSELVAAQMEVADLKAAIHDQNVKIDTYKTLTLQAQARFKAAQKAAQLAKTGAEHSVTALLNRPYAPTLEAACKAADTLILEYTK